MAAAAAAAAAVAGLAVPLHRDCCLLVPCWMALMSHTVTARRDSGPIEVMPLAACEMLAAGASAESETTETAVSALAWPVAVRRKSVAAVVSAEVAAESDAEGPVSIARFAV